MKNFKKLIKEAYLGNPLNEDSLDDEAKRYFIQKVSRGEIDTLPENPKEEFLAQMMKDQMDHDEETLRREKGLEEEESEMTPEEEHEHVKNLLKRNFMDETEAKLNESPYPTSKKYKELENVINNELTSKGELFKGMRNNDLKAILRALKGKKTYMLSTDRQKMLRQLMGKAGTLKELDIESSSDAALDNEVNKTGFAESKEFNFKKMIKEALTPNYLK